MNPTAAEILKLRPTIFNAQMPPIAIIWSRRGKKVIVSLRSDGSVDVAKIAQMYGGGGHAVAAGFSWEVDTFLAFQKAQSL